MKKEQLWIASFQHTSDTGIKSRCTCVLGKNIGEALKNAEDRIKEYMAAGPEGYVSVITDIGIAEKNAYEHLGTVFADQINDPDPQLFK